MSEREMTSVEAEQVTLKIRCSDGRSRKPQELRGKIVHTIRQPGGILFPDLCAYNVKNKFPVVGRLLGGVARFVSRKSLLFQINTMVGLKEPAVILLMSHHPCGAADLLGLSEVQVEQRLIWWADRLSDLYPHIKVEIITEKHSECGKEHHGHQRLCHHPPRQKVA